MQIYRVLLTTLILAPFASAGGSLTWIEATQRLTKECPKLLAVINDCFDVKPTGRALRLGARNIDVMEGRSGVGDRVPPYEFACKPKGSGDSYSLTLEISDRDDGWKFIIREMPMKDSGKQDRSDLPAPHPESK